MQPPSTSSTSLRDRARASRHRLSVNFDARRNGEPTWQRADALLPQLNEEDKAFVREVLTLTDEKHRGGSLFLRKNREDNWQMKFMHKTRPCDGEGPTLLEAAHRLIAALDYIEAGRGDERCQAVFRVIDTDPRFAGARLFYKKCQEIYGRPLKAKLEHKERGWSRLDTTLRAAMDSLAEHMSYEEVTPQNQNGLIWDKLKELMDTHHPNCKLFFKGSKEMGPHDELETAWRVKADHPSYGVVFEAKSRILEAAAGQVLDGLSAAPEVATLPGDIDEGHILSPTSEKDNFDFVDASENFVDTAETEDAEHGKPGTAPANISA